MKNAPRRHLAGLAALATGAALLVTLVPQAASAAAVVSADPAAVSYEGLARVTFTTTTPFVPAGMPGSGPGAGTQVVLVRTDTVGKAEDTIVGDVVEAATPAPTTSITATFALPTGSATAAPRNPGRYDVFVYVGQRSSGDTCTGCFQLVAPAPTLESTNVPMLPTGVNGQVFRATGTGFSRDTVLQALLPDTTTVDPSVTFTNALQAGDPVNGPTPVPNTATTISKTIAVAGTATPGPRDLRVLGTDGRTGILRGGLRLTSIRIEQINPQAGANDQSLPTVLTGRGLPSGATVQLVNEATPTVGTINGTAVSGSGTSLSATFDLNGALPGNYQVRVASADGSASTPECSPVFTVVDVQRTPAQGRASKARTDFTCREGGTAPATPSPGASSSASPSPSTSASATPTMTASPRPSGSATGSPRPTTTATATATASSTAQVGPATPTVSVQPGTIQVPQKATVSGTAQPGTTVEIRAYSRPFTQFQTVRSATVDSSGRYSFVVGPSGNTRLFARSIDGSGRTADSPSVVLTVRTSLNLKVARTGTRTYRFTGSTLPKRAGQLVTVFSQKAGGSRTILSRARVATDGTYNVTRRFTGTGTFTFFTGTGTDNNNAAGNSNTVRTAIR